MNDTTNRRPVKRTCKLLFGNTLAMTFIDADGKATADAYELREVGGDAGRSFRLTKIVETGAGLDARRQRAQTYTCHLSGDGQQACQCKGFSFRGVCRHTESLRALIARGVIRGGYPAGGEPEVESTDDPCECY